MGGGFAGPEPPMGDPSMGADPNAMGGAPMDDPNMDGDMGADTSIGGGNPNRERDQIQKNIGKACSDFRNYQGQDKEDLGKWIEGMLDSVYDETDDAGIDDESESGEQPPMDSQIPQMESVIFTKGQLDKINEEFGIDNMSKKDDNKKEEVKSKKNNNSPFSNPNLNK